jgi:hypothetical protein
MWQLTRKSMGLWCHEPFSPTRPCRWTKRRSCCVSIPGVKVHAIIQTLPTPATGRNTPRFRMRTARMIQPWSLWTSSCAAVKILLHKLRSFFTKWWTSKPPNQQLLSQLLDWPDLHLSTTGDIPPLCVPVSKIDELVFFGGCSINLA